LEQISAQATDTSDKKEQSLLGSEAEKQAADKNIRSWLCAQVVQDIGPLTAGWGVKIINFQLESTKIADPKYAMEYEEASLAMAKAKANRRAVSTQNDILIQQAEASSRAVQIEAEGKKISAIKAAEGRADSQIVEAKAAAKSRLMEADARNEAATKMSDNFGQQLAMMDRNVQIAGGLKATTLVVSSDAGIARSVLTPVQGAAGVSAAAK